MIGTALLWQANFGGNHILSLTISPRDNKTPSWEGVQNEPLRGLERIESHGSSSLTTHCHNVWVGNNPQWRLWTVRRSNLDLLRHASSRKVSQWNTGWLVALPYLQTVRPLATGSLQKQSIKPGYGVLRSCPPSVCICSQAGLRTLSSCPVYLNMGYFPIPFPGMANCWLEPGTMRLKGECLITKILPGQSTTQWSFPPVLSLTHCRKTRAWDTCGSCEEQNGGLMEYI
jgi:hypothetical protein